MAFPINPNTGDIHNGYVYNSGAWTKMDPSKQFDVGFTYFQLPGEQSPSERGWYGTWSNISSQFAGDFFRAEGGAASNFESGRQQHALQHHSHAVGTWSSPYVGGGTNYNPPYNDSNTTADDNKSNEMIKGPITETGKPTVRVANETRSVNRTIRVWKRTA